MTYRPILFSAPMVRALLDGSKTQTRRIVKGLDVRAGMPEPEWRSLISCCPYGQPGNRLWVREAWRSRWMFNKTPPRDISPLCPVHYEAGGSPAPGDGFWGNLRPSMFMPRWASRITLEITGVRVERLQDISEADCWKEGVEEVMHDFADGSQIDMAYRLGLCVEDAKPLYAQLWESINGPGSWDLNPWVWVVEFKRVTS